MRSDGTVTYWQFQHNITEPDSGKPAKWVEVGGTIEARGFNAPRNTKGKVVVDVWREHTACGKCWQRHGYHGFLTVKEAMKALPLVTKCYRAYEVRIVKITKSQHTEECVLVRRKQVA
jgi:nicotinic acid phosphoribosyltransferase